MKSELTKLKIGEFSKMMQVTVKSPETHARYMWMAYGTKKTLKNGFPSSKCPLKRKGMTDECHANGRKSIDVNELTS